MYLFSRIDAFDTTNAWKSKYDKRILKKNIDNQIRVKIGNDHIDQSDESKLLGIVMNNTLTWKNHIFVVDKLLNIGALCPNTQKCAPKIECF